jgi:hypothetical protein
MSLFIIFTAISLFLVNDIAQGQCVPGQRSRPTVSGQQAGDGGPWIGTWVPASITPSNRPGNHTHYATVTYQGGYQCGYTPICGAACAFSGGAGINVMCVVIQVINTLG